MNILLAWFVVWKSLVLCLVLDKFYKDELLHVFALLQSFFMLARDIMSRLNRKMVG